MATDDNAADDPSPPAPSGRAARPSAASHRFATTHWSVVLRASGQSDEAGAGRASDAGRALATLCERYWFPLYAFVRRAGYSADDAQDLTQEFFVRLLDKNVLATAEPQRGRFRSFLLGAMKHFLANEARRRGAQKRGGDRAPISLDLTAGEDRYRALEPADHLTPERLFDRRWALTVLEVVLGRLREEYGAAGKAELFGDLAPYLAAGDAQPAYAEVAARRGVGEGAIKVAVHRLRRRYRALLEEEIAQTTDGAAALEDELRELLAALSST